MLKLHVNHFCYREVHASVYTYTIIINDQPLEKLQSYKYMGVHISSDLFWSNHISNVCSMAKKQMGMLYHYFYCNCEPSTLENFYTSFMGPLLEYAVPVWDPHLVKELLWLWSLFKDLLQKCLATKVWEDVDYDEWLLCSTCQF